MIYQYNPLSMPRLCTVYSSPTQAKFWTWAGTVHFLHGSCAGDKELFSSQTEAQG